MSNRGKSKFTIRLKNGKKARLRRMVIQPYQNCEISAGLVNGAGPDTIYLRFDRDNDKPTTFFMRPDEALAVCYVLAGAMWSDEIKRLVKKT